MGDWQGYIDSSLIGSGHMHSAAILGNDGSYWAYGGDAVPQPDEAQHIVKAIQNPDLARASGVTIAGTKYLVLRAEPGLLIFKKGGAGGCAAASMQGVVLGIYGSVEELNLTSIEYANPNKMIDIQESDAKKGASGVNPADCNATVQNIANYLKQSQY